MSYAITLYERLPSITAIRTNIEIIFFPIGDSEREENKIKPLIKLVYAD